MQPPREKAHLPSRTPWGQPIDDKLAESYRGLAENAMALSRALSSIVGAKQTQKSAQGVLKLLRTTSQRLEKPWKLDLDDIFRIEGALDTAKFFPVDSGPSSPPDHRGDWDYEERAKEIVRRLQRKISAWETFWGE